MRRAHLLAKAMMVLFALAADAARADCPRATDFSSNPPQEVTDASGADYFPSDLNTTNQPSFCSGRSADTPCASHRVYKPAPGARVYPQLLLFLPGSGMEPRLHELVLQMGAYAGYRTIGLSYDTRYDPGARDGSVCVGKPDCAACYGPAREEIITGESMSPHLTIQKGDSVIRRLFQLLRKLNEEDMRDGRNDDHWDSHLDSSNTVMPIAWRNIIVAGFSQGAGHAAYISQLYGARGLVMLDGGYDTCGKDRDGNDVLADWYKPVPVAIPKYFVGHCRPEGGISCLPGMPTPPTLKRLGFPDPFIVLEKSGLSASAAVTWTTQEKVTKLPSEQDALPGNQTCSEHYSMARDGCMPTSARSEAAAETVPQVYLFEPYLARFCKACYGPDCPSPRPLELLLVGSEHSTELSGRPSVPTTIGVTVTEDDPNAHAALYGISWRERGDDPCEVTLKIENLMTYFDRPDVSTQKCGTGKDPTSTALLANFDDRWGTRAFMTGIRVCMDRQDDKVKGFQIFGQAIDNNGDLYPLPLTTLKERTNCHHWAKTVASCPAGQLATAAELHFEREANEKKPRSLTGVRLLCRKLYKQGFGTLP